MEFTSSISENQLQQEPSIESILSSIRTILFDDIEEFQYLPTLEVEASEQVLESLDMSGLLLQKDTVQLSPKEIKSRPEFASETEQVSNSQEYDIFTLINTLVSEEAKRTTAESAAQMRLQCQTSGEKVDIISAPTTTVSAAALNSLTGVARESYSYMSRALTLEVLVRKTLRPLLKRWINDHLPLMVEKIVSIEIKRLIDQISNNSNKNNSKLV